MQKKLSELKTIDAKHFIKMMEYGVLNLKKHYQEVNDLNVFPVPDGDTGINMRRTIETGYDAIRSYEGNNISEVASMMAKGALLGARGNSGVILSQIFRGFSYGVQYKKVLGVAGLNVAFRSAVKKAYSSVNNPVEGTILTVLRESVKAAGRNTACTVAQYLKNLVTQAKITLDKTIDMMDVLKEAGVIDSGGAGYYYIVQGFMFYFNEIGIEEEKETQKSVFEEATPHEKTTQLDLSLFNEDSVLDYGYCTEFMIQLQTSKVGNVSEFDEQVVIDYLETQGDSIVCFKDGSIVKTHVHTKDPGAVLSYVRRWGEFLTVKIENMSLQHNNVVAKEKAELDEKMPHKEYGSVAVCQGEGIKAAYKEVGVDKIIDGGQTMNPSSEDFVRCFEKMDCDNIVVLPNNSNIIMAAEQAAQIFEESHPSVKVMVIKTKSVAQGFLAANMFLFDGLTYDEVKENIYSAIENVASLEITTATRNTTINNIKVYKDHFIGILDHNLVSCDKDLNGCLLKALDVLKAERDVDGAILIYGKDCADQDREKVLENVKNALPYVEINEVDGGQDIYPLNIALF